MPRRLVTGAMALAIGLTTHVSIALAASAPAAEKTPLNLGASSGGKPSIGSSSGGSLLRTVIGLVVVVLVIWGISKFLRFLKTNKDGKASGNGLASVATLPLGNNRAVHVVRVGSEILLLGTAEHNVTQLARYTEEEARAHGLLDTAAPRKPLNETLRNAAARTASMRSTPAGQVTTQDVEPVAVTRNGSPVHAGNGTIVSNILDQLRARTVRK